MPVTFIELIEGYKQTVSICDVEEAARRIANEPNLVVIDVREPAEFDAGAVSVAINIPRGFLEFKIAETCSSGDHPILIHCKSGGRAILAAKTLAEMGYSRVGVVAGPIEDLLAAVD
jgi:phage shock protein E